MGGSNSTVDIQIVLEAPEVRMGQEIIGVIYLQTTKKVKVSSLVFRFKGEQIIDATQPQSVSNKHTICKKQKVIFEWQNFLQPGQYSFPFHFATPQQIPSTFYLPEIGQIVYSIHAILFKKKNTKITKNSLPVTLLQQYNMLVNSIRQSTPFPIKGCCMSNKGVSLVKAWLNHNAYNPNDTGYLVIQVDNTNCTRSIQSIQIRLQRIIRLSRKYRGPVIKADTVINCSYIQRIPNGVSLLSEQGIQIQLPFNTQKAFLASSTQGKIIQCFYKIYVTMNYGSCVTPKQIDIPVTILPQSQKRPEPIPPENWQPITMPLNRFSYEEANAYSPSAPIED